MLQYLIETHQIEIAVTDVSFYPSQMLSRTKQQRFIARIKINIAGEYRIEVSDLTEITFDLYVFEFGDLEGDVRFFFRE
tara:strand:- start:14 stop:250 length:237 start_codon:yes stop_codon:yes gene_type:complete